MGAVQVSCSKARVQQRPMDGVCMQHATVSASTHDHHTMGRWQLAAAPLQWFNIVRASSVRIIPWVREVDAIDIGRVIARIASHTITSDLRRIEAKSASAHQRKGAPAPDLHSQAAWCAAPQLGVCCTAPQGQAAPPGNSPGRSRQGRHWPGC